MAESLKVLRRRLRSVRNTKQITRAMEMVSASKLRRAQTALLAARPYIRTLGKLLARLSPAAREAGHPFFVSRETKRATLVVFTADRGLCGSFNSNLLRQAEAKLSRAGATEMQLVCIGKRGSEYLSKLGWPVLARLTDLGGMLDRGATNKMTAFLRDRYQHGETDEVHLLYSTFVSTAVNRPTLERFLPVDPAGLLGDEASIEGVGNLDYIFEPGSERVLNQLLPAFLEAKLYIALAESLTSEHSARMVAMNNASKNCDELTDTLALRLNKARQGSITKDLLDIVGGAEAQQQG